MYCTQCGEQIEAVDCFCRKCGTATGRPATAPQRPLLRSVTNSRIAGVCAGLATYMQMDVTVMRILWLLLLFGLPPAGLFGYIAAWIVMPKEQLPLYAPSEPWPAQPQ